MATYLYGDRAPSNETFVTLSTSTNLDNERVLTGTANQITITDGGAGTTVTLSLTDPLVLGANGLDITPGSDTDTDLLTLNVTGTPKIWWDESEDLLAFTKGLLINPGVLDMVEMAAPAAPGTANALRLYAEDIKGFSFPSYIDTAGMRRKLMRDSVFVAKNVRGTTIAANRIVYATGSADNVPTIDAAKADAVATMPAIGVTIESIADQAYGRVMQVGLLEDINTAALAEGNVLYVSDATAGVPVTTPPTTPSLTQEIGTVLVSNASTGAIQIVARGLTGDEHGTIQNTFYLGDGTAGSKVLSFNASADGTLTWDETDFSVSAGLIVPTLKSTPDEITATSEGVAASVATLNTEVTTNGDSDLDNVTLANGVSGQVKHIYCVVEGNAADTWKITPATMCGGTQITFAGVGLGCTLVYADSEGWVVTGNNGGTIS
jgi:hypothetical protein